MPVTARQLTSAQSSVRNSITVSRLRRIVLFEAHKRGKLFRGEDLLRMRRCVGRVFDPLTFPLPVGIFAALVPSWSLVHRGGIVGSIWFFSQVVSISIAGELFAAESDRLYMCAVKMRNSFRESGPQVDDTETSS